MLFQFFKRLVYILFAIAQILTLINQLESVSLTFLDSSPIDSPIESY
jgi:hypothetical protein